jgi:hypothetical protein
MMAVIHTASRQAGYLKTCSYFVLKANASQNAKYRLASASRRLSPKGECGALLLMGNTFWQGNPLVIDLGRGPI